mmetsp:Transcript_60988/g.145328  ORF Transcript_60988/g.145328 Transcript_60988/m.145328 type:complete len:95 (-) Transcript_60988:187-471(-)|eukprot:CAMPEP_0178451838 /NCGR_PEP_ID=MMETSP0689_2-20121128/43910_1 /TAXON_ID=160604 /ORGANISM="Amphidinium massartii, Strain CS-259" /LENGTH=94 /DNA_ID=CAMNT_0020077475 /DNA_START=83 /DNA_END=367 /DNA_ORIENTATION=-
MPAETAATAAEPKKEQKKVVNLRLARPVEECIFDEQDLAIVFDGAPPKAKQQRQSQREKPLKFIIPSNVKSVDEKDVIMVDDWENFERAILGDF